MSEIRYKEPIGDDGTVANFVAPTEVMDEMYPSWRESNEAIGSNLMIRPEYSADGITMRGFNSNLRFMDLDEEVAVFGNTVKRLCALAPEGKVSCEDCAINALGLASAAEKNCAVANIATAFEQMHIALEARLMMRPLHPNVIVLGQETQLDKETADGDGIYKTFPDAQSVVIPQSQLEAFGLSEFAVGINGADSSLGMATFVYEDEKVAIAFCSTRENMGDRGDDEEIVSRGIVEYLKTRGLTEAERKVAQAQLDINVVIVAQAQLETFAHKIKKPSENQTASIIEKWGKVTNAGVLDNMYPGALQRGNIWPQFEAEAKGMGVEVHNPIDPEHCPGDGQTCHVDYPAETEYTVKKQLEKLNVRSITYNRSHSIDPAASDNNSASNRREQNNGVDKNRTNRTLNAVAVSFA